MYQKKINALYAINTQLLGKIPTKMFLKKHFCPYLNRILSDFMQA